MRITRVHLRNFRGVTDAEVTFGDGVTIVEGPNEAGKSTIAEAVRNARLYLDSSTAADVRATKSIGTDAGPEVELDVESGPYRMTLAKRWLKTPTTTLSVSGGPKPVQESGRPAHELFNRLLEETVDLDLLDALEIVQGASLEQPDLARTTALRSALGEGDADLQHGDALMERIAQEHDRYFTATGRPRGEYRAAQEAAESTAAAHAELAAREAELQRLTDDYARREATLTDLRGRLAEHRTELAAYVERLKGTEGLVDAAAQAAQALATAEDGLAAATHARDERVAAVEDGAARAGRITKLEASAADAEAKSAAAAERLASATEALAAAEKARDVAHDEADALRALVDRRRDAAEREGLAQRIARAKEANARITAAKAAMAGTAVSEADVRRLAKLEQELRIAQSTRDAAAPQATIRALGDQAITVGDDTIGTGGVAERAVVDPLHIEVPGIVSVDIEPGTSGAKLQERIDRRQQELDDALAALDVTDVDAAREAADRQKEARDASEAARRDLESAIAGADLTDLEGQLAAIDLRLEQAGGDGDADDSRSLEQLRSEETDAREALADAERSLAAARTALDAERDAAQKAALDFTRGSEELRTQRAELDRVRQALEAARAKQADEDLEQAVTAAEQARDQARERDAAAQAAIREADIDGLRLLHGNASKVVDRDEHDIAATLSGVQQLKGVIDDRAAEGVYDKAAASAAAAAAAQATLDTVEARANAARLLNQVMGRHQAQAHQRYVAPFKERIEKLGGLVFGPGFQVSVSDDLRITDRTLDGITVPFESLSAGAREQVSLLGRLAAAQLVDPDHGAPVILDDALGFSDADRLRLLGAVLSSVGDSAQVIVLTSQPGRFQNVGGARVERPFS